MSLIWFLKDLWNDIKTNIFKIFVWKTTEPQSHLGKHPNPHLVFWVGFGIIFYSLSQKQITTPMGLSLLTIWFIFCYLIKRYWSGKWRSYKKRMEEKL